MTNNLGFLVHLFLLLLLQLGIFDNIQISSYISINIYILVIYILPYRMRNAAILFSGFLLGMLVDLANNTMGIHMAAATLTAYLRPRLLQLTSNREQIEDVLGKQRVDESGWFFKYIVVSTVIYNAVLMFCEAFSLDNILITLMRIVCSSAVSVFFILLYYWVALKKKES